MRTGIAHLPLHYGKAPRWLFEKMVLLSREIVKIIIFEYGPEEFLSRIADPYWFQSFGCILGFDWHSSGLTTTVCGALKEGIRGHERELGIYSAGGKGGASRKTPAEIEKHAYASSLSVDVEGLIYASRMSAKVDSAALQDGYELYHHNFLFTGTGMWVVVQQGMNTQTKWARRYHWLSKDVDDFVNEPHSAICCDHRSPTINLVAKESGEIRAHCAKLAKSEPGVILKEIKGLIRMDMPQEHRIFFDSLSPDSISRVLLKTYEEQPGRFERLLGIKGVGARTVRALTLLSEARYSFAHGGKDGHPYPVDLEAYQRSVDFLEGVLRNAKIGHSEKKRAFMRLRRFLR